MNAVVLLIGFNSVLGLALMSLHNYRKWSCYLATIGAILLGLFVLLGPLDEPISILGTGIKLETTYRFLGRQLVVDGGNRSALAYMYLAGAFFFGGGWIARPSRFFYSAGVLAVLAIVVSLMVQPFLYAAIFIEMAALAVTFVLVDPAKPGVQAALRLLLFYSLSMMSILMAGWLLDTSGVTTGAPELVERVVRFLAIGFGVLLMVPPFHLWLPSAADSADKYSLVFCTVMLYSAGLFILIRYLNEFEWLRNSILLLRGLRLSGMVMVLLGGLWALSQKDLARSIVFLLLADFGTTMIMLSLPASGGYSLALVMSGARIISIAVWGLGASLLDRVAENRESIIGSAYSNPLPSTAMLVGMLSLAGLPMTAGFPGRWGAIQILGREEFLPAIILITGIILAVATGMRWMTLLLDRPDRAPATIDLAPLERYGLSLGIGLCLLLGIFPQAFFPWISQALFGLENLIR
jgi:formate hydrogenlyase subunit 3/multisubunit Na+/H+ antiporter MnhD subunit